MQSDGYVYQMVEMTDNTKSSVSRLEGKIKGLHFLQGLQQ